MPRLFLEWENITFCLLLSRLFIMNWLKCSKKNQPKKTIYPDAKTLIPFAGCFHALSFPFSSYVERQMYDWINKCPRALCSNMNSCVMEMPHFAAFCTAVQPWQISAGGTAPGPLSVLQQNDRAGVPMCNWSSHVQKLQTHNSLVHSLSTPTDYFQASPAHLKSLAHKPPLCSCICIWLHCRA